MTDGAANLGWERIWREQGPRWELQEPQPEVVALAAPEEGGSLDAVIAWDVVYHATVDGILRTLQGIHDKLKPGGYLLATFASTNPAARELSRREADEGLAQRLEPNTYVRPHDTVSDKALVHHYATEEELRGRLLAGFEVLSLEERREGGEAHWVVLARKGM